MLDTATMNRIIVEAPAFTDTAVPRDPAHGNRGADHEALLWVTGIGTEPAGIAELIGSFRRVYGAPSGNGWMYRHEAYGLVRVYGAVVNPELVDGHHYRSLNNGYVARYNDADHTGDRHDPHHAFSIVAGTGTSTWPYPNDSIDELTQYVEIEWGVATGRQTNAPEVMEAAVAAADNSAAGPTRGLGQPGVDGLVPLNPDRVPGRQYIVWDSIAETFYRSVVATFHGEANPENLAEGFQYEGYYYGDAGDDLYFRTGTDPVTAPNDRIKWVELRLDTPAPASAESQTAARTALRAQLARLEQGRTDFNEALNTMAADKEWCSEYEDIITPLGFEGRDKEKTYDVDVSVSFTFTDGSTSGSLDRRIGEEYGLTMEVSEVRVEATATVSVTVTLNDDGDLSSDDFRRHIDSSDVEDALDNALSGVSSDEITDWTITDWTEQ